MEWFDKAEFSQEERERLAKKGYALPDGSFPIRNGKDLENAIRSVGRAKDYDQARAHIVKRAKELGLVSSLPDEWVGKDKRDKILKSLAILEVGYLAGDVSKDVITSARISANLLEKGGKRAQLGEIREFKGKKYKKLLMAGDQSLRDTLLGNRKKLV